MSFFKYLRTIDYFSIVAIIILVISQVWLDLKLPGYMKELTTLITSQGAVNMGEIWSIGGYMLLCALGSAAFAIATGYICARLSSQLGLKMRGDIYRKVGAFSLQEMSKFSTASLITRSTNDITQIQMAVAIGLQVLIKAPVTAIWAVVEIANKSWQWSTALAVALVFLLVVIAVIIVIALPKFKKVQKQTDKINLLAREQLKGIRVIRAYNAEEFQETKFEKANKDLTKTNLFAQTALSFLSPIMTMTVSGLSLAVYLIGAFLINSANGFTERQMLMGDMMTYISYAMLVIMSFIMLTVVLTILPRAIVSANRVKEVLNTPLSINDGEVLNGNSDKVGLVEFKNVSFKYPHAEEYVLHNISFSASPGETVAFIGSTGSGKSTLINLVPRFYDATEGEVLIDGVNVKEYKLEALNQKLGYVPQKAFLFSGTVASNVGYGDSSSSDNTNNIESAIKIAQAKPFIDKLEQGLEAPIDQGGVNVSGGQKQRLAIARAIARNPEIYIFDDSFSALDYKTDKKLRAELKKNTQNSTVLIVAQRIGTIRNADKIIVLDEGNMVGYGTHDELLKSCPVYKEIALSQLSKEELAK